MSQLEQIAADVSAVYDEMGDLVITATHSYPSGPASMDPATGRNVSPPPQTQPIRIIEDEMTVELSERHGVPLSSTTWMAEAAGLTADPAVGHTLTVDDATHTLTAVGRGPGYWELFA